MSPANDTQATYPIQDGVDFVFNVVGEGDSGVVNTGKLQGILDEMNEKGSGCGACE